MNDLIKKFLVSEKGPLAGEQIQGISSVSGGSIHQAWCLRLNSGKKLFAKTSTSDALPLFEFEAQGLQALRHFADSTWLQVPKPLACKKNGNLSVLLLPWINLGNGNQGSLGTGLGHLHHASSNKNPGSFGWETNGYIGSGPQPKGWSDNWGDYFVQFRLIPQLNLASQWGLKLSEVESLLSFLRVFLNAHKPVPSLVHGDLWSGNSGVAVNGKGVILDPAVWWADREVDLAMTRLFGGYSKDFYNSYQNVWPLSPSSKERIDIYNLYHLLNHANIFGGSYQTLCLSSIKKLKSLMIG